MSAVTVTFAFLVSQFVFSSQVAAVELKATRAELNCLLTHRQQIDRVSTPLVIVAPSLCPEIPFKNYDPVLLSKNSTGRMRGVRVYTKSRASCIVSKIPHVSGGERSGGPSEVLELKIDC
ncbi:hypothetical protein SPO1226a [Ruegeria pomeroyi DSS-3]|uniref:Uncharacterized protein n=2 Tax=Ruegeria pomeroyi TaxID=89184 RepID=V5UZD1_RUEPO|nr:hypothetical protein SPO1226a [Ruegeria pomeroyi DSS-3]